MDLTLTRSLNGIPKTQKELKQNIYKSETLSKIINDVNKRVVKKPISTDDKCR